MKSCISVWGFCIALLLGTSVFANTGNLDTANFGSPNGYVLENFTISSPNVPRIEAMLVKDDGKIIVVGEVFSGGLPFPAFIAQFNPDGSLDSSFNSSGMNLFQVTQNWQGSHSNNEATTAKALALVSDGILVVGNYSNVSPGGAYIIKFNLNGSFASFGTDDCNGSVSHNCSKLVDSGPHTYAFVGLGVTSANNTLVVGNDSHTSTNNFFVSQYDSSGNFDSSFGVSGFVASPDSYTANTAILQTDDKILIGGFSDISAMLGRVNSDGSFDSGFGISGIALYQFSGDQSTGQVKAVTLGTDGSIVATGSAALSTDYYGDLFVMKVDSSGSYDTSFNEQGFVFDDNDLGSDSTGVAVQSDASVLVAASWVNESYDQYMALMRYLSNGSLDSNFGTDGVSLAFSAYGASTALVYHNGKANLAGFGVPQGSFTDVIAQFFTVENEADLSIVKSSATSTASVGEQVSYTLTILNSGPQEASLITVSDPLPEGLGLVTGSLQSSSATCALEGSTISCSLSSLASGDSFTVTYQASVSAAGTLTNTATVSSSTEDPNPSNNSSSASITASGSSGGTPVLQVSVDCPPEVSIGAEATCETVIRNTGDGNSTDTTVAFTASDNWEFVSSTLLNSSLVSSFLRKNVSVLNCSGDPESCSLGTIVAGSSISLNVLMQVTGDGELILTANVSGNGGAVSSSGSGSVSANSFIAGGSCALSKGTSKNHFSFWMFAGGILLPMIRRAKLHS